MIDARGTFEELSETDIVQKKSSQAKQLEIMNIKLRKKLFITNVVLGITITLLVHLWLQ
ncbi:hypothetical protein GMB86_05660 [Terrilactibacillus sp. BCM23-1]|uniref:Uncharacterized protein n=1 Tax=Terrilactibacillus tamarindi TaxID=2599694 RepID=A0A6N8CN21_9BACI|nr:hypothetical protein [Terrilactibacillus tamarindi]MTT31499.1 hypothetical protein [Terrilactibacillus tamarindi]